MVGEKTPTQLGPFVVFSRIPDDGKNPKTPVIPYENTSSLDN
jgi:hypothetical protein